MAYFKIHGDQSGRVLDASMTCVGEVALWNDNGQDNQLWYWDATNRDVLRNKQFPNRVLDLNWHDYQRTGWGKVYLHTDLHGGWNQRWEFLNGEIACKGTQHRQIPNLRLDVHGSCTGNGSKVGVFQRNGAQNQKWTLKGEKTFFYILGSDSGRVLDASLSCPGEVVLWVKNGQDNQLWYWDGPNGDVLRNKQFPNKVLDFDYNEYDRTRWGRVYLTSDYHGGWNQRFQFVGGEIACKGYGAGGARAHQQVPNLRLDVFGGDRNDGAKVGIYQRTGRSNQKWKLA